MDTLKPKQRDQACSRWQRFTNGPFFARNLSFQVDLEPKYWHYAVYALDPPPQEPPDGLLRKFVLSFAVRRTLKTRILESRDTVLIFEVKLVPYGDPERRSMDRAIVQLEYDPLFYGVTRVTGKVYPGLWVYLFMVPIVLMMGLMLLVSWSTWAPGSVLLAIFWLYAIGRSYYVYSVLPRSIRTIFRDVSRGLHG